MDNQDINLLLQRTAELEKELAAKNRELEIEAALDRIRTRAMEMQRSDELKELIAAVSLELTKLDFALDRSFIIIYDPQTAGSTWWMSHPESPEPVGLFVKYHEHGPYLDQVNAWRERKLQWQYLLGGEAKKNWDAFLFTDTELSLLPQAVKEAMRGLPEVYISASHNNFGSVALATTVPLSNEQFDILLRFAKVFDLTYTRFNDLKQAEAQTREAQIQLALERVRARTMAMQKSEELPEAAQLLFRQTQCLRLPVLSCGYNIFEKDDAVCTAWMSDGSGAVLPVFRVPLTESPTFIRFRHSKQNNEKFYAEEVSGEALAEHYRYMLSLPNFKEIVGRFEEAGFLLPTYQVNYVVNFSHGNLLFITNCSVPKEDQQIFQRFAVVFEQTYKRFLDLQRAEAQAREARVEAALERVRARTMAMQKSNELADVAELLFAEVSSLGIKTWTSGFNVWSDDNNFYTDYLTNPQGGFIEPYTLDTRQYSVWSKMSEAKKRGDEFYVNYEEGEELAETYRQLGKVGEKQFNAILDSGFQFPTKQHEHLVFGQKVSLMFITYEAVPEAHDIFKRFGRVFEQTYTRFLDLQKAEAQVREAMIEAALEKVRSRSLAMHKSDELKDVIGVVFEKLKELGLVFEGAGIQLFTEGSKDIVQWVAAPDHLAAPILAVLPYTEEAYNESEIVRDMWMAKEKGESIYDKSYSFNEKNSFFQYAGRYNDFEQMPEKVREFQAKAPGYTLSLVAEKNSALWVDSYYGRSISEEGFSVLKRTAKVFEQAYIRFLDLQRAEAHARESQIEAAMERLRARAMAMQRSGELADVVKTMYTELKKLDESLNRCFIMIFDAQTQGITWWMAGDDEASTEQSYHIPFSSHPPQMAYLKGWQQQHEKWLYIMEGQEKKAWDGFLFHETELSQLPGFVIDYMKSFEKIYLSASFSSFGCLTTGSVQPLCEESFSILTRFSKVFDLSYTRFNDLKQAEAQAKRAEQDLIEIKAARRKAEDALTALKATQQQLIQQEKMASLGELTAGIAHEIQNPLNFVNNFSDVNKELLTEARRELSDGNYKEVEAIFDTLQANEEKIAHHGERADAIVKGMLQHARANTGEKQPTDINKLADEYLRLSYQGMRAKDKSFNAKIETSFDSTIGNVDVVPQDIGRVLLNLFNNAFYAVNEKSKQVSDGFEPIVSVTTKRLQDKIEITVTDNGTGIPQKAIDKIFQPFFTTKPTGEGTGLGLSLSYDIVTKGHNGSLSVRSAEGEGSEFVVQLPFLD